jgi:hypothetical protein
MTRIGGTQILAVGVVVTGAEIVEWEARRGSAQSRVNASCICVRAYMGNLLTAQTNSLKKDRVLNFLMIY